MFRINSTYNNSMRGTEQSVPQYLPCALYSKIENNGTIQIRCIKRNKEKA